MIVRSNVRVQVMRYYGEGGQNKVLLGGQINKKKNY